MDQAGLRVRPVIAILAGSIRPVTNSITLATAAPGDLRKFQLPLVGLALSRISTSLGLNAALCELSQLLIALANLTSLVILESGKSSAAAIVLKRVLDRVDERHVLHIGVKDVRVIVDDVDVRVAQLLT